MKIVEIRGFDLSFPLEEKMGNALNLFAKRDAFLLQIVTDEGTVGWGEAGNSPRAASALIRTRFASNLLGKSPLDFGRHHQVLSNMLGYDRRGAAMMALSAVDIATHELAAKAYGISVAKLLGGAVRDSVFAYASGPYLREGSAPYASYGADVESYLKKGFKAIKPRAGFDPKADGLMANALRKLVGNNVAIMVDMNQSYTAHAAIESARRMQEADLLWIEEPVQPEDIVGYQTFARSVPIAIAGGEALAGVGAFRDFLTAGTFSILQPDLSICGGYTTLRQIAALGKAFELPVMPHVFGTVVNFLATLQVAATLEPRRGGGPTVYPYIEFDMMNNPLMALNGEIPVSSDSTIEVPDVPGTGLDLSPEKLEPWLVGSWTERL
ncbi:D-galactarolactone cycloisomerase [Rhizobium sp. ERR 922]|uniref:mandelate racemase/muconate lactonizing enzyme family protein n=1 Tax=unclassified Rhizobium TaxID=2613769 RepID=UPI0011A85235|nr:MULTISPECIES: mandelate racemase/muconate lactonizing enzyme family protein [unclassified Rhizobium]TWB46427.1 D-galactarolactone cycloisomerase [Rhizobium sp. ERR 922]TWB88794.1 D-galactarolactone cycloisomerase [Rhizobium sp. ERR 942]